MMKGVIELSFVCVPCREWPLVEVMEVYIRDDSISESESDNESVPESDHESVPEPGQETESESDQESELESDMDTSVQYKRRIRHCATGFINYVQDGTIL
ncbi:hypothetical protein DPMN_171854 [Dreissena polymorpha]|uniref:Uncharacterized protein n=1 Tax=Dreissena polymorpha TaxID=45954 RepID=A0A9D4E1Z1_DREPO|nr:hypothetical protein DPMN_171854 [Dreissena polymorpha]